MDMSEHRRATNIKKAVNGVSDAKALVGEESMEMGLIKALESKLRESQMAVMKKEAELDYFRRKNGKEDGAVPSTTRDATSTSKKDLPAVADSRDAVAVGGWNPLAGVLGGRKKSLTVDSSSASRDNGRKKSQTPKEVAAGIAEAKASMQGRSGLEAGSRIMSD